VGELSLDGSIRNVRGALPIAIEARGRKISRIVVTELNAKEAAMVSGVDVDPVKLLIDVVHFLNTGNGILPVAVDQQALLSEAQHFPVDFKDVRGQQTAKRALEVACAGGHNILMIGPPGSGRPCWPSAFRPSCRLSRSKKRWRRRRSTASRECSIRVRVWSGCVRFERRTHTISDAGLIGGGVIPRPGEVSLAHNGVLFLDELPEFPRNVLEVMRQPLEDGTV
jgi:magnesium chelatase family protein